MAPVQHQNASFLRHRKNRWHDLCYARERVITEWDASCKIRAGRSEGRSLHDSCRRSPARSTPTSGRHRAELGGRILQVACRPILCKSRADGPSELGAIFPASRVPTRVLQVACRVRVVPRSRRHHPDFVLKGSSFDARKRGTKSEFDLTDRFHTLSD